MKGRNKFNDFPYLILVDRWFTQRISLIMTFMNLFLTASSLFAYRLEWLDDMNWLTLFWCTSYPIVDNSKNGKLFVVAPATWAWIHSRNVRWYQKCGSYWVSPQWMETCRELATLWFPGNRSCTPIPSMNVIQTQVFSFHRNRLHSAAARDRRQRKWTGFENRSVTRSGDAKTECRKRRNRTSGKQMSPLCGLQRASSRSNISVVWRSSSRVECKCARKPSRFLEWVFRCRCRVTA